MDNSEETSEERLDKAADFFDYLYQNPEKAALLPQRAVLEFAYADEFSFEIKTLGRTSVEVAKEEDMVGVLVKIPFSAKSQSGQAVIAVKA